jgi:signal transduction histidine kinase
MRAKEQEMHEEEKWKYTVSKLGLAIASCILLTRFTSDLFLLGPSVFSNYITLFASLLYGSLFIYVKKSKKFRTPIFAGVLIAFAIMIVKAEFTGGLHSPIMSWFPVLPIISSFVLSKKQTYTVATLSILSVILISTDILLPYFEMTTTDLPTLSRVIMYASIILLSTFICLIHEDKRIKMHNQIQEQKMKLMTSTRQAELGEIAAGIAHEVNNPLTVLKVKAKKIRFQTQNNPDLSDITTNANKILLMTERIQNIITSMKNLSKENRENGEVSKERYSVLLDNVITLCESRIKYSNILLKIVKSDSSVNDLMVPSQIGHVLLSLVTNSCDAISKSKQKWIEINAKVDNCSMVISVTDSGDGISKDQQQRIFNPFVSNKPDSLASGLGLSISKNVVESLGGSLNINPLSKNTSFVIVLPIKEIRSQESSKKVA